MGHTRTYTLEETMQDLQLCRQRSLIQESPGFSYEGMSIFLSADSVHGADLGADGAADALVGIDLALAILDHQSGAAHLQALLAADALFLIGDA